MDVEYPRFGEIVIGSVRFDRDVIVERGRARRRKKGPSKAYRGRFGHTPLAADEEIPIRFYATHSGGRLISMICNPSAWPPPVLQSYCKGKGEQSRRCGPIRL
ncbi:MAG: hypothetical protein ABR609_06905 [Acidimicrobiia bacterium]